MSWNKFLIFLIGLIAILLLVIAYLGINIKNIKQQILLPVFPRQFSRVAGGVQWELKNFQPVVKGYETKNGQNLVKVQFTSLNNQSVEVNLFVSGQTPSGYQLKEIILEKADGQVERLDFTTLKQRLPKGRRVRAEYVTAPPELLDISRCLNIAENFQPLCFLTDVLVKQNIGNVEETLKIGENRLLLVPVTALSLKLYEN